MYEDFYNIEAGQINMTNIYEMHDLFQPLLELPNVYSQNGNYPAAKFLHIPKNLSHNHCQHRKRVPRSPQVSRWGCRGVIMTLA